MGRKDLKLGRVWMERPGSEGERETRSLRVSEKPRVQERRVQGTRLTFEESPDPAPELNLVFSSSYSVGHRSPKKMGFPSGVARGGEGREREGGERRGGRVDSSSSGIL